MKVDNTKSVYATYEEVKKILRDNNVTTHLSYKFFVKKHPQLNLPSNPNSAYKKKGWIGWSDFFNCPKKSFPTIKGSIAILRLNKINSVEKYIEFRKENPQLNLPSNPNSAYKKKGWVSWCHYFGIGKNRHIKKFIPYDDFRKIIKENKIKTYLEYFLFRRNNPTLKLPYHPGRTYSGEKDIPKVFLKKPNVYILEKMYPLLGNNNNSGKALKNNDSTHIVSYEAAQRIIKENGITTQKDYYKLAREHRELNLPSTPRRFYKEKGWNCWTSFLGLGPKKAFLSYDEAKAIVRKNKIKTMVEYLEFSKNNPSLNLYLRPHMAYKGKGWKSRKEFLGLK